MTAATYSLALHRVRGIFVSVCLYFSSYCVGLCQMIPVVADAGDVAEVIVIAGYATACQQVGAVLQFDDAHGGFLIFLFHCFVLLI